AALALPRAARVAAAAAALDRRDTASRSTTRELVTERRTAAGPAARGADPAAPAPVRLGEQRRTIRPRTPRPNARTAR
ncbi:hypothetical protein, partial [Shewanella algae]|uniref:hypothetical protein n=1 Tax=Shewanella algae TaxID=38313 RepID=UPI00313BB02E